MPIQNGEYVQRTENDIVAAIEAQFRAEFGQDIDLTESSVFSTIAEVHAAVNAENQEADLQDVYQSGFLDTATGEDLNRVVAVTGIQRRDAIHSTGVQRFESAGPTDRDYAIQKGTTIQTDANNPIQYETTEFAKIAYVDGFENGTEFNSGDTGASTVVNTHAAVGDQSLQLDATSGAHVYSTDETLREGSEFHFDVYPEANTVPAFTFNVQNSDDYYQVVVDTSAGELRIEKVVDGAVDTTIDSQSYTLPSGGWLHGEVDWKTNGHIGVSLDDGTDEYTAGGNIGSEDRWRSGHVGFKSLDATANKYIDEVTTAAVTVNIRAKVGGEHGNVGSNSITILPSPPAGVNDTTNLYPVGDDAYTDTAGKVFRIGQAEETDEELRARAKDAVTKGGDATFDSLVSSLVNDVEGATSVSVYENKTSTDNTGSGGLPPHSFEAVVYGGDSKVIAETIFETKALTSHDYAGAYGTAVSETVTAESNGQEFTVEFSRPTELTVSLSTDIVVTDEYIGDGPLTDRLIEHIGGVNTDGEDVFGLEPSEDVYLDQLEDIIVGEDDTGVIGFDTSTSTEDITTTPAKTTNSNGLEIVSVGDTEVAQTTPDDITINATEQ